MRTMEGSITWLLLSYRICASTTTRTRLARRYGPSLVLLEHCLAPENEEGAETLDLVRIGADGTAHWSRVWPTPQDNPRHAGLELWMASYGYQILSRPASWSGWWED